MIRQFIAYFLVFALLAVIAAVLLYLRHHSHDNTHRRRRARESDDYKARMKAKQLDAEAKDEEAG